MARKRSCHLAALTAAWLLTTGIACSAWGWQPSAQPELQAQLAAAPQLEVQRLGAPAAAVGQYGVALVPHRQGNGYDALVFYARSYRRSERAYIINLATGEARRQDFSDWEGKGRIEVAFTWMDGLAPDGNLYGATPDWSHWNRGGAMGIFVYNPDVGRIELKKVVPNAGGERHALVAGVDGALYGTGTWISDDPDNDKHHHRAAITYRYDPRSDALRTFGPIGPPTRGTAMGYEFGVCDQYMYVSVGPVPWHLMAVNIQTGEQKVLAQADEGNFTARMRVWDVHPGARAFVRKNNADPGQHYWLWRGKMIPRQETDNTPPWEPSPSARERAPKPPEIHSGQLYPDADNRVVFWSRLPEDRNEQGSTPEAQGWRKVVIDNVETHGMVIHRLEVLPDGRIFGAGQGYHARFVFDPATDKSTRLGPGGGSIYALKTMGDRLYITGYPSAVLYAYDPTRDWTVGIGRAPGDQEPDLASPQSNPQRVHRNAEEVFNHTRVKKMFDAVIGADGRLYFGGIGQRDYHGGGLAWYDPNSGKIGGMWQRFDGDPGIYWLTTAIDARYIVIATRDDRIFLYDTQSQRLLEDTIQPVPGVGRVGPVLEVAPARLLGLTTDPELKGGGILYGIDLNTRQVAFRKKLPQTLPFTWTQGISQWGYSLGPDGKVYTFLGNHLVRIAPDNAHVQVLGKASPGRMVFVGNDLYLAGEEELRRVRNIAATG